LNPITSDNIKQEHHLYLVPGLGADERLFNRLELPGISLHHIKWVEPLKKESLSSYAARLCGQVDISKPFSLAGVSFGGILCVEMAKVINPEKVIVISSIKQQSEISALGILLKYLPLYYPAPKYLLRNMDMMLKFFFGAKSREELELLKSMLDNTSKTFINWAIHEIVHWKNCEVPSSVLHLAGSSDKIMLGVKIKDCRYIPGGTHLMVMQEATLIGNMMMDYLQEQ
jgi:hypothetical protein